MGTCISLPYLECMVPTRASEREIESPRRSAFIYLANGVHSLNYQITTQGKDYPFSRSLKPLEKHREVVTPISGLYHPGAMGHHHNCISFGLPVENWDPQTETRYRSIKRWRRSPRNKHVSLPWKLP